MARLFTTTETAKKISEKRLARKLKLGFINSEETRQKMRLAKLGKRLTEEYKKKISEALRKTPTFAKRKVEYTYV